MERYNSKTFDETGKIALHKDLQERLDLHMGDQLSLNIISSMLVFRKACPILFNSDTLITLEESGIVQVPAYIRAELGWKDGDELTVYHVKDFIIFKLRAS